VREFVVAHSGDARFRDECELLRPIDYGAGILYVVDGSRPYGRQYEAEMEVLRWTGRPRMALINLIAAGDHVEEWKAALAQYFSIVRVFDAVRADFGKRIDLLRAFGAIDESWAEPLGRAADALEDDRERRRRAAAGEIAGLLVDSLSATVTVPLATADADDAALASGRAKLQERVRRRERESRRSVQDLYRHDALAIDESAAPYLVADVFSAQSFSVFGLSAAQLALTGAASGAVAGTLIDVALGGASLLLGAGIGAAVGAAGTLAGAGRLAKVRVLGQPVLGRGLLHAKLVAERNHARRDSLALDAHAGAHLADGIDKDKRRELEDAFRRLRNERGVDAAENGALTETILELLE